MISENVIAVEDRGFAGKKLFKEFIDSDVLFLGWHSKPGQ